MSLLDRGLSLRSEFCPDILEYLLPHEASRGGRSGLGIIDTREVSKVWQDVTPTARPHHFTYRLQV